MDLIPIPHDGFDVDGRVEWSDRENSDRKLHRRVIQQSCELFSNAQSEQPLNK